MNEPTTFHVDITLLRLAVERGAALAMSEELSRQFYEQHAPRRVQFDFPTTQFASFEPSDVMDGVHIPGVTIVWDEP